MCLMLRGAVLVLGCLLWAGVAWAAPERSSWHVSQVVAVVDGDTLRVQNEAGQRSTVRLHAIDAPELAQCGGWPAHQAVVSWALRRFVLIEPVHVDRYGRTVARIHRSVGELGQYLLADGHAWLYPPMARELDAAERQERTHMQQLARQQRSGLWSCPRIQAPWEFRRELAQRKPPVSR